MNTTILKYFIICLVLSSQANAKLFGKDKDSSKKPENQKLSAGKSIEDVKKDELPKEPPEDPRCAKELNPDKIEAPPFKQNVGPVTALIYKCRATHGNQDTDIKEFFVHLFKDVNADLSVGYIINNSLDYKNDMISSYDYVTELEQYTNSVRLVRANNSLVAERQSLQCKPSNKFNYQSESYKPTFSIALNVKSYKGHESPILSVTKNGAKLFNLSCRFSPHKQVRSGQTTATDGRGYGSTSTATSKVDTTDHYIAEWCDSQTLYGSLQYDDQKQIEASCDQANIVQNLSYEQIFEKKKEDFTAVDLFKKVIHIQKQQ